MVIPVFASFWTKDVSLSSNVLAQSFYLYIESSIQFIPILNHLKLRMRNGLKSLFSSSVE